MPTEVYLIKVGMTMTEGTVDEWYVEDGQCVDVGLPLYRLETEKVNLDVEAEVAGTLKHVVTAGTEMEPGDVVGWIFAEGEEIPEQLPKAPAKRDLEVIEIESKSSAPTAAKADRTTNRVKASPAARKLARERDVDLSQVTGSGPGGRIVEQDVPAAPSVGKRVAASPAARQLATELGIDIATVVGTGPRNRVTKEDVENAVAHQTQAESAVVGVPMKGMRRTIAERMLESLRTTAQLTMTMEIGADQIVSLRKQLNDEWQEDQIHLTYTDFVTAAVARALRIHSRMNSMLIDGAIRTLDAVNVGIAVALDEGLIVPVLKNADSLALAELSKQSATLATRARTGKLSLDEVSEGCFTVTSLGMYGVDGFTPILNVPQTGILGVGRIYDGVQWVDETPVRTSKMRLSLTWDHQVIDGAPAAEYLNTVKDYLEAPDRMLE